MGGKITMNNKEVHKTTMRRLSTNTITALIAGIFAVVAATISGWFSYAGGLESKSVELLPIIEKYEAEIAKKNQEIEMLNAKLEDANIEKTESTPNGDATSDLIDKNGVSLMENYKSYDVSRSYYKEKKYDKFNMSGKEYSNGFVMEINFSDDCMTNFNVAKKYNTLSFDLGHIDDTKLGPLVLHIYMDGEKIQTINCEASEPVKNYTVELKKGELLKFVWEKGDIAHHNTSYGIANIKLI